MFKQGEMMAASLNKIYGKIGAVTLEIYSTFYHIITMVTTIF